MDVLKPEDIRDMTVQQLEDAQRALLYPWEVQAWSDSALEMSPSDPRGAMMDLLDRAICVRHMESALHS